MLVFGISQLIYSCFLKDASLVMHTLSVNSNFCKLFSFLGNIKSFALLLIIIKKINQPPVHLWHNALSDRQNLAELRTCSGK